MLFGRKPFYRFIVYSLHQERKDKARMVKNKDKLHEYFVFTVDLQAVLIALNQKLAVYIVANYKLITQFLYPPHRGYISFVNTFVTPRNNVLGPYVPWRHLISAKF